MSIVDSLKRLFDRAQPHPSAHEQQRDARPSEPAAAAPDGETAPRPRDLRTCRVCGYQGPHRFCLRCLAETMEPRR